MADDKSDARIFGAVLLPFLFFGGWRWLFKGARDRKAIMGDAPILLLFLLGIALVAAGLSVLASYDGTGVEGRYHPPVFRDGEIEPGHFEKSALPGQSVK